MKALQYINARDLKYASQALGRDPDAARILAGGVDLLSEMKERIIEPARLVNIKSIPGLNVVKADAKGLTLGALVTLTEIDRHAAIRRDYTALAESAESVASPQIRNMGTIGGNLCQRPRCWYYRDEHTICLKKGGPKCYAVEGENQYHAILGGGPCFIVHPSDPAPALMALGARVLIEGGAKPREVPLEEFFVLPAQNVRRENILAQNEVVTHVLVPAPAPNTRSVYVKERERDSYDWALASAAVVIRAEGGKVRTARVVLGGVAPVPWRAPEAEKALVGQALTEATFARAAEAALAGAKPMTKNAYKVPLAQAVVKRALSLTMA